MRAGKETVAESEDLADVSFAEESSRMYAWVTLDNLGK